MRNPRKFAVLLIAAWLPSVFPCGTDLKGLTPASEYLAIQNAEDGNWALDDNGMLTMAMVGSWVFQDLKDDYYHPTDTEKKCIDDLNRSRGWDWDHQVTSSWVNSERLNQIPAASLEAAKTECNYDLKAKAEQAYQEYLDQPVKRAAKAQGIARKAADRYAEIVKVHSNPEYYKRIDANPDQIDAHLFLINKNKDLLRSFADALAKPGVTAKDLVAFYDKFGPVIADEKFPVVSSLPGDVTVEDLTPYYVPAEGILMGFGSRLPNTTHTMCASGISDATMDALAKGNWLPIENVRLMRQDGGANADQ